MTTVNVPPNLVLHGETLSEDFIIASNGQVVGVGTINGTISNAGLIGAGQQDFPGAQSPLTINGPVTGTGHLVVSAGILILTSGGRRAGAELDLNGPVSQDVVFSDTWGILRLDDPTHFTGSIRPVAGDNNIFSDQGDHVLLPGISLGSITSYSYSGDANGGTLTLQESGGSHLDLKFSGTFDTASFTLSNSSTLPGSLDISGFKGPPPPPLPANPGNVDEWILKDQDGHWAASAQPGSHPAGYRVATVADFTHDGTSDILWQNVNDGTLDLWKMKNGAWASSVDLGKHPGTGWQIAGAGDFNHDGTSDVLWFNPGTGETDIWQMANGQWAASVQPGSHPLGYQIAGIGDFNRDGTSDVLWFNPTTGDVDEWNIVNGHWAGSNDIGTHPGSGWQIAGVGDFNGDGTSDVFWVNSNTKATDIWHLLNGKFAGNVIPDSDPHSQVAGISDFNGDGISNVLWYNPTTGDTVLWVTETGSITLDLGVHPGSGWAIAGAGNFNGGGGTSDILWHQFV
jgi:hypothetical protein